MQITYSDLSCKLATSFSTFSIFIYLVKMINCYGAHAVLRDIEYQLKENIIHHFTAFYEIFIKLRCFFNSLKTIYRQIL